MVVDCAKEAQVCHATNGIICTTVWVLGNIDASCPALRRSCIIAQKIRNSFIVIFNITFSLVPNALHKARLPRNVLLHYEFIIFLEIEHRSCRT